MNRNFHTPPLFLQGVIAPMFTPVHPDGSLDLPGADEFVRWLRSRRCVQTIFARSGMGRMFSFTVAETKEFGKSVMEAGEGQIGVLLGCSGEWLTRDSDRTKRPDSSCYTSQAIELTAYAHEIKADGAVHVMPEAITPTGDQSLEDAIFLYFKAVHDAADIPIIIYQPGGLLPEYRLTANLLIRLLTLPRIAGLKISTHQDEVFSPIAEVVHGTRFALIAGDETYFLRALELGACGVIGEGCCVYPEILSAIMARFYSGQWEEASVAQADVRRALEIAEGTNSATLWKQVIALQGPKVAPYDRSGQEPYAPKRVQQAAEALQTILKPYHRAS